MKALVLAAGEGQRLRPLTEVLPKALVPVLDIPLIDFALEALAEAEISETIVNAHHLGHLVESHMKSYTGKVHCRTIFEETLLGTGGALRNVAGEFRQSTFAIVNADVLHGIDLKNAAAAHAKQAPLATLLLRSTGWEKVGGFWVGEDGRIGGYLAPGQKPPSGGHAGLFTGLHFLESEILKSLPSEKIFCIVRKLYCPLLEKGAPLQGIFADNAPWNDLGTPERYLTANLSLLESLGKDETLSKRARRLLERRGITEQSPGRWGTSSKVSNWGKDLMGILLAGSGVLVSKDAAFAGSCILGSNSTVESGAALSRCITWQGTSVSPGNWRERIFFRKREML